LLRLLIGKYPRLKHLPGQKHNDDVEWQTYQDQLWSIAPFLIASDLFAAQRPKGLVNGHIGDPVVIEFIERATRKRRGIPAMSQTAGSGL
jgi:hypothetical protein